MPLHVIVLVGCSRLRSSFIRILPTFTDQVLLTRYSGCSIPAKNMHCYSRASLFSIRNTMKFVSGHVPVRRRDLSSDVWEWLKDLNLLTPARGQRGREHLRIHSVKAYFTTGRNFNNSRPFKELNSNVLNIQTWTLQRSCSSGYQQSSVLIPVNINKHQVQLTKDSETEDNQSVKRTLVTFRRNWRKWWG